MALSFDDVFIGTSLTKVINDIAAPDVPVLEALLTDVVDEAGIATTTATIDRDGEIVTFIPTAPRGGVPEPHRTAPRGAVPVQAVHLPTHSSVLADSVQDLRETGGTTLMTPEKVRDKHLRGMRKNLEYTMALHLLGAVKGLVLDTDGSPILDIFSLFGVAQQTVNFALDVSGTNILRKGIDAQRKSEDALGGVTPTNYIGLASPSFMDALREHAYYEKVLQYAAPSNLMSDYRTGIVVGDTTFVELRSQPGSPIAIEAGTAYVVPEGDKALFLRRFAPADWNETVNKEGYPFYAKAEAMPMDRGYYMEAQTNPFTLCTRPASIVKVTATAP